MDTFPIFNPPTDDSITCFTECNNYMVIGLDSGKIVFSRLIFNPRPVLEQIDQLIIQNSPVMNLSFLNSEDTLFVYYSNKTLLYLRIKWNLRTITLENVTNFQSKRVLREIKVYKDIFLLVYESKFCLYKVIEEQPSSREDPKKTSTKKQTLKQILTKSISPKSLYSFEIIPGRLVILNSLENITVYDFQNSVDMIFNYGGLKPISIFSFREKVFVATNGGILSLNFPDDREVTFESFKLFNGKFPSIESLRENKASLPKTILFDGKLVFVNPETNYLSYFDLTTESETLLPFQVGVSSRMEVIADLHDNNTNDGVKMSNLNNTPEKQDKYLILGNKEKICFLPEEDHFSRAKKMIRVGEPSSFTKLLERESFTDGQQQVFLIMMFEECVKKREIGVAAMLLEKQLRVLRKTPESKAEIKDTAKRIELKDFCSFVIGEIERTENDVETFKKAQKVSQTVIETLVKFKEFDWKIIKGDTDGISKVDSLIMMMGVFHWSCLERGKKSKLNKYELSRILFHNNQFTSSFLEKAKRVGIITTSIYEELKVSFLAAMKEEDEIGSLIEAFVLRKGDLYNNLSFFVKKYFSLNSTKNPHRLNKKLLHLNGSLFIILGVLLRSPGEEKRKLGFQALSKLFSLSFFPGLETELKESNESSEEFSIKIAKSIGLTEFLLEWVVPENINNVTLSLKATLPFEDQLSFWKRVVHSKDWAASEEKRLFTIMFDIYIKELSDEYETSVILSELDRCLFSLKKEIFEGGSIDGNIFSREIENLSLIEIIISDFFLISDKRPILEHLNGLLCGEQEERTLNVLKIVYPVLLSFTKLSSSLSFLFESKSFSVLSHCFLISTYTSIKNSEMSGGNPLAESSYSKEQIIEENIKKVCHTFLSSSECYSDKSCWSFFSKFLSMAEIIERIDLMDLLEITRKNAKFNCLIEVYKEKVRYLSKEKFVEKIKVETARERLNEDKEKLENVVRGTGVSLKEEPVCYWCQGEIRDRKFNMAIGNSKFYHLQCHGDLK